MTQVPIITGGKNHSSQNHTHKDIHTNHPHIPCLSLPLSLCHCLSITLTMKQVAVCLDCISQYTRGGDGLIIMIITVEQCAPNIYRDLHRFVHSQPGGIYFLKSVNLTSCENYYRYISQLLFWYFFYFVQILHIQM